MPPAPGTLDHPPFPRMTWTDSNWWEGTAHLPAWAGFQSRRGAYGSADGKKESDGNALVCLAPADRTTRIPSAAQAEAFKFLSSHGDEVVSCVLTALKSHYEKLRPRWQAFYPAAELERIMPEIHQLEDFKNLMGLSQVHVHRWAREDMAYIGLEFGCTWDEEHGFGVMLHGSRVVEIGAADVSFAWAPTEYKKA